MEQQQIKVLIDAMSASDLEEMEFSQDGWKLRLARRAGSRNQPQLTHAREAPPFPDGMTDWSAEAPAAGALGAKLPRRADSIGTPDVPDMPGEVIAPLYGVVHLRQAPGEPPLVSPGQAVTSGQTLCLIEAMKTFVEVRAEADGIVGELLVESGQEVDAGQVLLRYA